jgi:glycerol uptake facilitator-like aquaporin
MDQHQLNKEINHVKKRSTSSIETETKPFMTKHSKAKKVKRRHKSSIWNCSMDSNIVSSEIMREFFATTTFMFLLFIGAYNIKNLSCSLALIDAVSLFITMVFFSSHVFCNPIMSIFFHILDKTRSIGHVISLIIAQFSGAFFAFLLYSLAVESPFDNRKYLIITSHVTDYVVITNELVAMFFFSILTFYLHDKTSQNHLNDVNYKFVYGVLYFAVHFITMGITNSPINPLRVFVGTAIGSDFGIIQLYYWIGNFSGALIATILYYFWFQKTYSSGGMVDKEEEEDDDDDDDDEDD